MAGTVRIDGENLVFEIHGVDEILAFKRSISLPLSHVVSVSTDDQSWNITGLKVAGASLPHLVKDGRFLTDEGLLFFEMHHPEKCITVSLDHERYKKVVFEVDDKFATARLIRDAIGMR